MFDLHGKVALITGSSRGIGLAIAERMAEFGAKVKLSSRKQEARAQAAERIAADGGVALEHAPNISDRAP
ncbi:MAG: SDR family NAD(P)-dependent oxidoreductase, partial [Candidatus Eremiobacteraeota bacterium]|nr:SDR family NAD(P)-dependent oxidoreductase [Candidatus Eremiobacteraeota bacterium]